MCLLQGGGKNKCINKRSPIRCFFLWYLVSKIVLNFKVKLILSNAQKNSIFFRGYVLRCVLYKVVVTKKCKKIVCPFRPLIYVDIVPSGTMCLAAMYV